MSQNSGYRRRTAGIVIVLAAVLSCMVPAAMAASESGSPAALVPMFDWQAVPGRAVDLSIDAEGEAYAIDAEGHVWHWRPDSQRWGPMSGTFARIVGAGGNRPWAIDAKGRIYRYNGLWWEKKGEGGADVAADTRGDVLVAALTGGLRRWNALRGEWSPFPAAAPAVRVALAPDGTPWTLDRQGRVRFYDGKRWVLVAGNFQALDLAADANQRGWVVTRSGSLLAWQPDRSRWQAIPLPRGRLAQAVAIAPDGKPWVILRGGAMIGATRLGPPPGKDKATEPQATVPHAQEPHAPSEQAASLSALPAVAPSAVPVPVVPNPVVTAQVPPSVRSGKTGGRRTVYIDPATITETGPLTFTDTKATANFVAIGSDGSVFALSSGGDVERWSNAKHKLENFPGSLVRIAVDPSGNPWGISALGRIFRHAGTRWKQITGTASDIGIGADGTVFVTSNSGGLYRLDAAGTAFTRTSGTGLVVAVDPDGHPWTIDSSGYVRNCTTSPCATIAQKAISIAIGPDRSIYIVSDGNILMRYDATSGKFVRVNIPRYTPKQVAVGPSGYPWVVTTAGELLSSHMFKRNEAGDILEARRTSGNTTGSGTTATVASVGGFVFTKNMSFQTVGTSVFSAGDYVHLFAGKDGKIYGYGGTYATYNSSKKAFEKLSTELDKQNYDTDSFGVTSNGDIWAYTTNPITGLFRQHNSTLTQYKVNGLTASYVTVGPDDSVYAIFYSGSNYYIYKKDSSSNTFKKFSNYNQVSDIGVGPGNDVWIVDKNSYVREWDGSDFVKRPAKGHKAGRLAVSDNGTVYIQDLNDNSLLKWNGTNKSFDKVNNSTLYYLTVDSNGRPWINSSNTPVVKYGKD